MADWASITYNGESVGTLYFENEQIGFIPVVSSPTAVPGYGRVVEYIKSGLYAANKVATEDVYFGILTLLGRDSAFAYVESTGDAVDKPSKDTTGLTDSYLSTLKSPYSATLDDDGTVLQVTMETGNNVLARENGEWVEITDENYVDSDGLGFKYITESSIEEYDRMINSNEVPTGDDLESPE